MIWHVKAAVLFGSILFAAVPAAAQPVAARGPAVLQPEAAGDTLQWAASVNSVNDLTREPEATRVFGVSGGDPAMNGLYTYLAFYVDLDVGWRVFKIGDFLDYSIAAQAPGRVVLDINEHLMNRQTEIRAERRRIEIRWTRARDGAPPQRVTVRTLPSPARPRR